MNSPDFPLSVFLCGEGCTNQRGRQRSRLHTHCSMRLLVQPPAQHSFITLGHIKHWRKPLQTLCPLHLAHIPSSSRATSKPESSRDIELGLQRKSPDPSPPDWSAPFRRDTQNCSSHFKRCFNSLYSHNIWEQRATDSKYEATYLFLFLWSHSR